ncbi:MAG TPA: PQQ-binding-like beta-propeller repeat protein, partial [Ktedonobacteraceae bacterium]|nr:PQQ-binding-like beta-propeller repeat protein [Ktedonobacteraceae bacterium]
MKHFARWLFICMMLGMALVGTSLRSPSTHAAGCLSTEYPTFGYDMQRTSWNSQECILAGALPAVQWLNPYAGVTFADKEGVSVYKDQAFVGQVNQMLAYNRFTGAINWSFATGAPLVGAATVYQNQLFFGSPDTRLYSLKPTGVVLWVASVGVPISSTPAGFDKLVIVSMDNGAVYAFDVLTGALVWSTPILGKTVSSPAIFD